VSDIVNSQSAITDIMAATFLLATHTSNESMKKNGWEALILGSDANENLTKLAQNETLRLYTQIMVIIMAQILKEQKEHGKSGRYHYTTHPERDMGKLVDRGMAKSGRTPNRKK